MLCLNTILLNWCVHVHSGLSYSKRSLVHYSIDEFYMSHSQSSICVCYLSPFVFVK